jgi:hypothetical protein
MPYSWPNEMIPEDYSQTWYYSPGSETNYTFLKITQGKE